jgi:exodeoxyribonuclease VII small subunit
MPCSPGCARTSNAETKEMETKTTELPDFEKALEELESLVEQLESGELNLDQSLQQFKRGVELTRHCQGVLEQAQQLVEQLIEPDDESSATPFERDD